ncbi:MAG TPA: hypothetical protein VIM65_13555 [Cyclobacteriaceae bacterium]
MNTTPKFYRNLWGNLQGNLNTSTWTLVTEAWQNKQYLQSFHTLLDYINPSLRAIHGNSSQTEFKVPHGSVVVNIAIKNDSLEIECPMVDISSATRVPLLRKTAELNFYPLSLAQMRLSSNQLVFHYSSTLDTSEPFKTYYVLKEICQTADRYDDEFKEKFKAKSLVEPRVKYASPDEVEKAWTMTNEIINETMQFVAYFDSQRWFGSSLDFMMIALKRIDLCIQVQGFLKNEVERTIGDLGNGQLSVTDRNQIGKKFLQQIQQSGKESFSRNLYQSEIFIPEKWRTNAEQVKNNIQNALTQTQKYHNEKNYIASCIESLYCIYDLFYKNNMDHAINDILFNALDNAAGKTWAESSGILLGGLQSVSNSSFNLN